MLSVYSSSLYEHRKWGIFSAISGYFYYASHTAMDGIYEQMAQIKAADTRGDVYEYLLSKIATAGVNGQFRTPRHIIRMMVDLMEPKADEIVCESKTQNLIQINDCPLRGVA